MSKDSSDDIKHPSVPWNAWYGIAFSLVLFVAAQIAASLIIALYPSVRGWSHTRAVYWLQNDLSAQLSYLFLASGLTLGGLYLFMKNHGREAFGAIGIKKPKWMDAFYGAAAFPIYYFCLFLVVVIAKIVFPDLNVNQAQELGLDGSYGSWQLVLIFISLVILAPLTEEILFRGFLYGSFKKVMPLWFAVILTSGLFAAGHLTEGGSGGPLYIGAIDTFVLSLMLIFLRETTGRLWASMTLHAVKNAVAFTYLYIVHVH